MDLEDYLPKNGREREVYQKVLNCEEISKDEANLIGSEGDNQGNYPHKYAFLRDDLISGRIGVHSVVFALAGKGKDLVSKFPKIPQNWKKIVRGENMQQKAYEMGLKVAKPEGLYKVFDLDKKEFYSGFVMEHMGMLPINEIRNLKEEICESRSNNYCLKFGENLRNSCIATQELYEKALREYEKAGLEAEAKGFSKIDYRETNAFWVPKLNDVRLIDCDEWDYPLNKK